MAFRILVDVADDMDKVVRILYENAAERRFKQATGAAKNFVDALRVAVEKVGERFAGGVLGRSRVEVCDFLRADEQMKMVAQQAIGVRFSDGRNMMGVFAQEVLIIFVAAKEILAIDAAVINVVESAGKQRRNVGLHGEGLPQNTNADRVWNPVSVLLNRLTNGTNHLFQLSNFHTARRR